MTDFFSRRSKAIAVVTVAAAMIDAAPHRPKLAVV
jgi:hypothetical protein